MHNFSEVLSLFSSLPSVEGAMIADSDGLALASSFKPKDAHVALSPVFHILLDSVFRQLQELGQSANQICIVQDTRLIITVPVFDVFLVVFSEKSNLDQLQSTIQTAVQQILSIVKPELQNI
jgi:predicted regulator of Ras-like GTPase activity (Roadblock/LC7/MglB family)